MAEERGDAQGQPQPRIGTPGFEGVDGLSADPEFLAQALLGPAPFGAQDTNLVIHTPRLP